MQSNWLKQYPKGVSHEIHTTRWGSVNDFLEHAFQKFSSRPAVTCLGTTLTYRDLSQAVERFALALKEDLGIKKGDRVAIVLPNLLQFVIAELAVLRIGAICVNTNPLYTPREMAHQFKDSGAKVVIVLDQFVSKLAEVADECGLSFVVTTSIKDQLPLWKAIVFDLKQKSPRPVKLSSPQWSFQKLMKKRRKKQALAKELLTQNDLAILQYTGGTTGVSKGAMLSHGNILANMMQIQQFVKPYLSEGEETALTALPLYHVFALTVNFLSFLAQGHHLILVPNPNPIRGVSDLFRKYPISVMTGVNTLFNSMNRCETFKAISPKTIKVAIAGGAALQEHVAKAFQVITGTKVLEGYGLTEASPVTHVNPLRLDTPVGSIGIPLPSTHAKVVHENGDSIDPGEVGELVVRGPQVMQGYWQRPAESQSILKDGWLWTGDMARVNDDGYFFIVDRKKDMILVSGFNVYPNEVEEVISSHPQVLEAAVIGIPDEKTGESVKAFVVKKDPALTEEDLKAFCRKQLAGYKIPRSYEFLESLPKSNVGKILRRELRVNPSSRT